MTPRLRMAVVGVGYLGQHHARLLTDRDDVELIGVVDVNLDRAREVAAAYHTEAYAHPQVLQGRVDAVTIAVPTQCHVEVALPFVDAGVPVLVEKPIASTVKDADRLLAVARERSTLVAVGHTERFNPAVEAALPLVSAPRFVEIHRLGAFPERSLDIDVVFDLMIHDLDLLLTVVGGEVVSIDAIGVNVLTPRADIANARLRFASGCIANLTASRISRDRVRKARFFQKDSYVSIDYAAQELDVYRLVSQGGRPTIHGGRVAIVNEEPLRRELADFVAAVRNGRQPGVPGQAGREALALASRVADKMAESATANTHDDIRHL